MNSQAIVAILLATVVVLFFAIGAINTVNHPELLNEARAKIWAEVVMAIVGGLLVYVSSQGKN